MLSNNPLKQYFRRPAIYLKLPSGGKGYSEGVINMPETGELPVYPMTAIDEITSKTPDALFNGNAIVDLIKSCIPDIKDPWSVTNIDLDAILIAIKTASQGNDFTIESTCPECKEEARYGINLIGILSTMKQGDYEKLLETGELKIKFRPLIYKEMNENGVGQFEIQKVFAGLENLPDDERIAKTQLAIVEITEITMKILTKTIDYIQIPDQRIIEKEYILDFLHNCDKNLYTEIRDYHQKIKEATDLKPLEVKCIHCQHEYLQPFVLNTSDFFG
jgi:hypothetical protein